MAYQQSRDGAGVGGRGYWRGGRGFHVKPRGSTNTSVQQLSIQQPQEPFGPLIDDIIVKALLVEEEAPKIENVEYVSSYNWLASNSTILVPGSPPAWTPPATTTKLKPDSEAVFRDINAARYPSHPLEPAVRSIMVMQPDFDLPSVDVVGCGSTIGNLFRCAAGKTEDDFGPIRPFRFDVDIIGDTVFFVRRGSSPTELINDLRGYGHTFPESYTTWDPDVRGSCSSQRIIQYDFGGLHFLVRSETDGYIRESKKSLPSNNKKPADKNSLEIEVGSLAMNTINVVPTGDLEVRLQGTVVSQDRIFDIKTRASYKKYDMSEALPRLWLNQTSKLLIAYHNFGLFETPQVSDIGEEVLEWEKENSSLLARFHALIKRIVDVIRDTDNGPYEVSWEGQGLLRVTKQIGDGRRALPSELFHLLETS